jgi:hypothetical protein
VLSLGVLFAMAAPSALAGSLLSGYGGPGGGTQAILGSTLVNGGGSGGGGGASTGSGGGASSGGATTTQSGGAATSAGAHGTATRTAGGGQRHGPGSSGVAGTSAGASGTTGASGTYTYHGGQPAGAAAGPQEAGLLGLSVADLLLIVLAVGVLVLTAGLTRRLTSVQRHASRDAGLTR